MNAKLAARLLNKMSSDLLDKRCGLDDEEIEELSKELEGTDCGLEKKELKSLAESYESLPQEKKILLAEKMINHKIYEEDIINRYGISRTTMYRWVEKGKLPPFRVEGGKKNYLWSQEADEWVKRQ